MTPDAEIIRLAEDARRVKNWKRWGPYLSERQWATVREDYSADGNSWDYFPHAHARSRAYRWGEDGLLGITDRECRLCFALALWNGRDSILKERLFGLTNGQGNHGEDVKETYFYLDATPTASYLKAQYRYPQAAFPYEKLLAENARRTKRDPEFELLDTGNFDGNRFFDVIAEYAKAAPDDLLIKITLINRSPEFADIAVLPTLWFRNTWSWGGKLGESAWPKPSLRLAGPAAVVANHTTLNRFRWTVGPAPGGQQPEIVFTENDTDMEAVFGQPNRGKFVKDAFHRYVVAGDSNAVARDGPATKAAAVYRLRIPASGNVELRLRLTAENEVKPEPLGPSFDSVFAERIAEAEAFYETKIPAGMAAEERAVARQAYAGLLWSKQFYMYIVENWENGDPLQPPPPPNRGAIRNGDWPHLYSRDIISMPDAWEYPWFAAWDLAFHLVPLARIDPEYAKEQAILFLREWYMHPNGQVPAYEWNFSDVNPPVHAWSCWRIYKLTGPRGARDRTFLARCFHKLLLNFTWWVNRKDIEGNHLFAGGFLGLDNVGIFDRSRPLPGGAQLEQADGTAWMAFFCLTMLAMALELASHEPEYEDVASKFFEHFVAIADAMNTLGGSGLWDEQDGFYYDRLHAPHGDSAPARLRSVVGLVPLIAVEVLQDDVIARLPGFRKRLDWFLANRQDLGKQVAYCERSGGHGRRLLAIPSRDRLERVLRCMLDESELLSPFGVRSLSKHYAAHPLVIRLDGQEFRVAYVPGESDSRMFGGNSNWRGPVWFPINYLLIEALQRYHHFYGDRFLIECPTGSGVMLDLDQVARELSRRMAALFLPDKSGVRPCHGPDRRWADDPLWRDHILFYEYFHGDDGRGLGASHQTGWTSLVVRLLEDSGWACGPDGELCAVDFAKSRLVLADGVRSASKG
jgi:Mannosylglycerate hydrolase MGH1-like glycoside hydrolase domain